MRTPSFNGLCGLAATASLLWHGVSAQTGPYTHPATGIEFIAQTITTAQTPGGFFFGFALPENAATVAADEYIGIMVGSHNGGAGYAGISHGGGMPNALLLIAWANGNNVVSSFRFAGGYTDPEIYAGDATLSTIHQSVNSTHWTLVYRCQGCWSWDHNGATGNRPTTEGVMVIGWAATQDPITAPANPNSAVPQHLRQGLFGLPVSEATSSEYEEWAELGGTPTSVPPTSSATPTPTISGRPVPTDAGEVFDYIVVGSGAGGIPIADRLSEAGRKVLLIEKGPVSSGRYGGRLRPAWLDGTNLTRFDVPGLCNQIWVDSAGIACPDVPVMAGCVLGGGTAVNAGLWWRAPARDWDVNFPSGWKAGDMDQYTRRVFARIPSDDTTSMDGRRYFQQGYEVVAGGLRAAGWVNVTANNVPDTKNRAYSYTPFMFSGGERGGPLATYLWTATRRSNFELWTGTQVRRLIRTGARITGVEVEPFINGGYVGTVNVRPNGVGRVVLSAGVYGTAKILFRSGIGPTDQLEIVRNSARDGATMIPQAQWINLPVGYNIIDHVNTDIVVLHPSVVPYDFYAAWNTPIPADRDNYLRNRSGPLAIAAPNIGPLFWQQIVGADGITRQLQWQMRVEGARGEFSPQALCISQYLGTGQVSRGRIGITSSLNMAVLEPPYLRNQNDIEAVIRGIEDMQAILSRVPNLTFAHPAPGMTAREYVEGYEVTTGSRSANHWMGSTKLGTDDGRRSGGTAVVDLNTKVYGTDNLFVVDAGIFPGMVTTNPSALVVVASERAAARILALR